MKLKNEQTPLTREEKDHLLLWASATPEQRLVWLEGALNLAFRSGALENREQDAALKLKESVSLR